MHMSERLNPLKMGWDYTMTIEGELWNSEDPAHSNKQYGWIENMRVFIDPITSFRCNEGFTYQPGDRIRLQITETGPSSVYGIPLRKICCVLDQLQEQRETLKVRVTGPSIHDVRNAVSDPHKFVSSDFSLRGVFTEVRGAQFRDERPPMDNTYGVHISAIETTTNGRYRVTADLADPEQARDLEREIYIGDWMRWFESDVKIADLPRMFQGIPAADRPEKVLYFKNDHQIYILTDAGSTDISDLFPHQAVETFVEECSPGDLKVALAGRQARTQLSNAIGTSNYLPVGLTLTNEGMLAMTRKK